MKEGVLIGSYSYLGFTHAAVYPYSHHAIARVRRCNVCMYLYIAHNMHTWHACTVARTRIKLMHRVSTGREFPESGREKALSRPDGKFKSGISGISGQNQSSNYGKIVHTFCRNFQRFLIHLKQHMRGLLIWKDYTRLYSP